MTLIFSPAETIVGENVTRIAASSSGASRGAIGGDALERPLRVRGVLAERLHQRARRLGQVVARAALAEPRDQRRQLEQRVVGQPGHGGVRRASRCVATLKRNVPFSATQTPYRRRSP